MLQDSRPEMQHLHAILKGPLVMAGLSHGENALSVKGYEDRISSDIKQYSLPPSTGAGHPFFNTDRSAHFGCRPIQR